MSFRRALFPPWARNLSKLSQKLNVLSKRVKAKLRVQKEEQSVVPGQFNTSLNQLKNFIGYGPKFYDVLYKTDLRKPPSTQNPKNRNGYYLV